MLLKVKIIIVKEKVINLLLVHLLTRRNIDNPIFPSIGSSLKLDVELSGGDLLPGDVDYLKNWFYS